MNARQLRLARMLINESNNRSNRVVLEPTIGQATQAPDPVDTCQAFRRAYLPKGESLIQNPPSKRDRKTSWRQGKDEFHGTTILARSTGAGLQQVKDQAGRTKLRTLPSISHY